MGAKNRMIDRVSPIHEMGATQLGVPVDFGSLLQQESINSPQVFAERVLRAVRDL